MRKRMMMTMALVASILFATVIAASASEQDVTQPSGVKMSRKADRMDISVRLNMETIEVGNNSLVTLTPMIVSDSDTLSLSTVGLYGRRRWFYYQRNQKHIPDAFKDRNAGTGKGTTDYGLDNKYGNSILFYSEIRRLNNIKQIL